MIITPRLFEAFLKCPTKCWLQSRGEVATASDYADWVRSQNESYRSEGVRRLIAGIPPNECVTSPPETENLKMAKWRLAVDFVADTQNLEYTVHAMERVPSEGRGKAATFTPIRFVFTNKLSRVDKLLAGFDALVLSGGALGRGVGLGKIIHGDNYSTLKVKTSALVGEVRKRAERISELLANPSPPDLVLNRHCGECEFRTRCREKAIEKDDLSLLSGMSEKERKKLHSKGIFTVTQLSYTFRPRRRPKRLRDKKEKYHHALKALAIREKKIHIVGTPELKIEGTPVYLDVEGLPDRDFYYLIGMRIGNGETAVQHSLWADTVEDEGKIWREFLRIIETVEKPVLIHYGSFETTFLTRMNKRYGGFGVDLEAPLQKRSNVNFLSIIFGRCYFPTYTNGLKELARYLGFSWHESNPSGLQTICWRHNWEGTREDALKSRLLVYNTDDCAALQCICEGISQFLNPTNEVDFRETVLVEDLSVADTMWPTFASPIAAFETINKAGRWNYQRDRIYIRTDKIVRRASRRSAAPSSRSICPTKEVTRDPSPFCSTCGRKADKQCDTSRILYDFRFGRFGLRTWVVRYSYRTYHCRHCHSIFGTPEEFRKGSMYGRNVLGTVVYMLIELCVTQRAIANCLNRMFKLGIQEHEVYHLKGWAARFYDQTRKQILTRMLSGDLIHADESSIVIKKRRHYVWVFSTFREVVYFYTETREAFFLQETLHDFHGVLVSDFYAAYDSIPCPQQKCLIHLMRDLNEAILEHPFDNELKALVVSFGDLLKGIVDTIDRRGLRHHFLRRHRREVDKFYRSICKREYQSEAALKCRERFNKNREKLFTFLDHDGVPWNNNNAEHAIKAFARLRRGIEGLTTAKGIEEYLILLSVCQTCKYSGVDFLDFLRSGEKDIYAFAERKGGRRRGRASVVEAPAAGPTEDPEMERPF